MRDFNSEHRSFTVAATAITAATFFCDSRSPTSEISRGFVQFKIFTTNQINEPKMYAAAENIQEKLKKPVVFAGAKV